jgi:ATP-binding cassette subfamily C (CFTR/MRP) protein 1
MTLTTRSQISNTFYQHKNYRAITLVRGSLVSLIYNKTLHIDITAVDQSSSVTLMSADVERVGTGMRFIHEAWGSVLDISLAVYLLQRQLGVASVAPAVLFLSAISPSVYPN